jgi:hypothetical protein
MNHLETAALMPPIYRCNWLWVSSLEHSASGTKKWRSYVKKAEIARNEPF